MLEVATASLPVQAALHDMRQLDAKLTQRNFGASASVRPFQFFCVPASCVPLNAVAFWTRGRRDASEDASAHL